MSQHKLTPTTTDLMSGAAIPVLPKSPNFPIMHAEPGMKRDPLRPTKVAILGTAPSSRLLAPFNDPEWTIWGSSPGNMGEPGNPTTPQALPRFDAWFEVHSNLLWPGNEMYGRPYVEWLNKQTAPVVTTDQKLFPRSMPFPWQDLVRKFGPYFFSSTFAWMMAYAIEAGAKVIGLYGVDMASKDEYILQRPGGHYFIQEARRRGIEIVVPPESDLLQPPPLYGVTTSTPLARKIAARRKEVADRIAQTNAQIGALQGQLAYLNGALEDITYFDQIWGGLQIVDSSQAPLVPLQ